jgi:hypothetical protein
MKRARIRSEVLIIMGILVAILATFFVLRLQYKPVKQLKADINRDGITNEVDQQFLNDKYGESCTGCGEDIDGDGIVDVTDLLLLLAEIEEN